MVLLLTVVRERIILLTIGSGAFIPGFEEQLVGAEIGKEVEVNVTFPEDYQAEELKGKAAVFKCTS